MQKKLIVGLGNPGKSYEKTRHNLGWMVLDRFVERNCPDAGFKQWKKGDAVLAECVTDDDKLLLLKPQTYMNRSGNAVRQAMDYFDLSAQDLILLYDDVDIDFGRLKIAESGSAAGHRGVDSVISSIGSTDFLRIRLGVKNKKKTRVPTDKFVLQRFGFFERRQLDDVLEHGSGALRCLQEEDVDVCRNRFH